MPVTITKPQATLRELLAGLKKRTGLFGEQILRTQTASDFYSVVGTGRNRIINGAMMIDQRNAGASVSVTDSNQYTLDRWQGVSSQPSSKFTIQQSSTAPNGFSNSLLVTSSSGYSVGSGDYFMVRQKIEGFNTFDLGWGTAAAKSVTISFWVRSSLTGSFGAAVVNSANSYSYPFSYFVNNANTWEQKTISLPGPTAGTWIGATNGIGLQLKLSLGTGSTYSGTANTWASADLLQPTGSTSLVGTSGATWYVTGVQIESGTVATPFEYRSYGQELALCQRYYEVLLADSTATWSNGHGYNLNIYLQHKWNVPKRIRGATIVFSDSSANLFTMYGTTSSSSTLAGVLTGNPTLASSDVDRLSFYLTVTDGQYTNYGTSVLWALKSGKFISCSAEL